MGSVQGVENRGLKVGEIGKKYTTFHNVLQSKKCKEVGTKKGLELGLKGSGKFRPFHPLPPSPQLPVSSISQIDNALHLSFCIAHFLLAGISHDW